MKKYLLIPAVLLAFGPLSACTSDRPEWLGGEPKRPAADVRIDGPRRPPALNPSPYAPVPGEMPPVPSKAPPDIDTNPYQYYYQGSGDEQQQPGYMPPPVMPGEPQVMEQDDESPRQALPVDLSYETETVKTAPIPPAPEEIRPSAAMQEVLEAKPAPAESEDGPLKHSWFSRMGERIAGEPDSPEMARLKENPYPNLSDVPKRPVELQELKTSHEARLSELALEHAMAQESRAMLAAEPSQGETLLGHVSKDKSAPVVEANRLVEAPVKRAAKTLPGMAVSTNALRPTLYDLQRRQEQALY